MLNNQLIDSFNHDLFTLNKPCPWFSFKGLIDEKRFVLLCNQFPTIDQFELHEGEYRKYGQRSHDRYYLSLERSHYGDHVPGEKGCADISQLSDVWQEFINFLKNDKKYKEFIFSLLGTESLKVRFAWHLAGQGMDVSPHIDTIDKLATHIFYFNPVESWDERWGGQTVFLEYKKIKEMNPEFKDFRKKHYAECIGNYSLLFKNTKDSWHGVETLKCPKSRFRKIFNVIYEKIK